MNAHWLKVQSLFTECSRLLRLEVNLRASIFLHAGQLTLQTEEAATGNQTLRPVPPLWLSEAVKGVAYCLDASAILQYHVVECYAEKIAAYFEEREEKSKMRFWFSNG